MLLNSITFSSVIRDKGWDAYETEMRRKIGMAIITTNRLFRIWKDKKNTKQTKTYLVIGWKTPSKCGIGDACYESHGQLSAPMSPLWIFNELRHVNSEWLRNIYLQRIYAYFRHIARKLLKLLVTSNVGHRASRPRGRDPKRRSSQIS